MFILAVNEHSHQKVKTNVDDMNVARGYDFVLMDIHDIGLIMSVTFRIGLIWKV